MTENPNPITTEVRKAIEHRATWMYLLLKEARDRGLEWDDFGRGGNQENWLDPRAAEKGKDGRPFQYGGVPDRFCGRDQSGGV